MKSPTVSLCYAFDQQYAGPAWVSLKSALARRDQEDAYVCHLVVDGDLLPGWTDRFKQLEDDNTRLVVHATEVLDDALPSVAPRRIAKSSCVRLSIDEFVDEPRVLYVDADTLVCRNLKLLFQSDLDGCTAGVVRDPWASELELLISQSSDAARSPKKQRADRRLQYAKFLQSVSGKSLFEYFNAGVLLIDLERFKSEGVGKRALKRFAYHSSRFTAQDVLNFVLAEDRKILPAGWNTSRGNHQICRLDLPSKHLDYFNEGRKAAGIIHYPGPIKPWQRSAHDYLGEDFRANILYAREPAAREVFEPVELASETQGLLHDHFGPEADPDINRATVYTNAETCRDSLTLLASKWKCDKGTRIGNAHRYTYLYDQLFFPLKDLPINFLELGLAILKPENGVDATPELQSPSASMWLEYFSKARIFGFDIEDFSHIEHSRFAFFQGDADDPASFAALRDLDCSFDVIIDDGSHASAHQQHALVQLFEKLKGGGLYIIEDLNWQPPRYENKTMCGKTAHLLRLMFERDLTIDDKIITEDVCQMLKANVAAFSIFPTFGGPDEGQSKLCVLRKHHDTDCVPPAL